jgi:hypothetical protein
MSTEFAMLEIMNAALISQGCDELLAHNDGTNEGRLLSLNWATIVEAELEMSNLHFSKKQVELVGRRDGLFGYQDAYVVPASALHVRKVWTEDETGVRSFPDWVQDGSCVHLDSPDAVTIEYIESADPSIWSANFTLGIQMKLEAVLLRFNSEYDKAQMMDANADIKFQNARTMSSKARSAKEPFKRGRLARARFVRG